MNSKLRENRYFHQYRCPPGSGTFTVPKAATRKSNTMKPANILPIVALSIALCGAGPQATAQDKPANTFLAQTTIHFTMPEGTTREEVQKAFQEYFDKVISKSTLIKHFAIYIHAWGSQGGSYVRSMEFASWEDLGKFEDELEALEKAAWPDEAARKAFLKKLESYSDMHHSDEIYSVMNSMRK